MRLRACLVLAILAAGLSTGCVTRRVMITSDPPGAIVFRNGQPIGPTPVEEPFVYYGKYRYRLVADGYAPLDAEPELLPPFYQYPGLDLIAENVLPFPFRDTQSLHFQLVPLQAVRHDDVRARAEELRGQGMTIGQPAGSQPRRTTRKETAKQPENKPTGLPDEKNSREQPETSTSPVRKGEGVSGFSNAERPANRPTSTGEGSR